ncbi:hypothetical protein Y11_33311 [Yersinia enterocolitica subsp. palearctica Y11]|uniref:Uncharacterized protein n=1 Tax=Yersinia enterocolitica subsp. palearctica serotype O:3 (strain DSM 13030 / CIP 106945 / Y11) TaxID=930944 RepID=A0A0H3NX59_YERE1|nr:hypothetical protein Y11_33311 [Yersinia enterocolitica subsp. palearctica Y11]
MRIIPVLANIYLNFTSEIFIYLANPQIAITSLTTLISHIFH